MTEGPSMASFGTSRQKSEKKNNGDLDPDTGKPKPRGAAAAGANYSFSNNKDSFSKDKKKGGSKNMFSEKGFPLRLLARRFFHVASAFFLGDEKVKARLLLAMLLLLACGTTGMHVVISYTRKDFANALTEKNATEFYSVVLQFASIIAFAAPFFATDDYLQGRMVVEWRLWLTKLLLGRYFANRAFFNLQMEGVLDNPDQRICEDVANFVNSSVTVIKVLAEKVLSILAFSAVLWSISPSIVAFLLTYALLGTYITLYLFGKKMMQLKFEGLQREADMRYSLVRVRDNVESIAFYRGEHREALSVHSFLNRLVENIHQRLRWTFALDIFTNGYRYATFILPGLVLAPRLFRGEIRYGDILQTSMAFQEIFRAVTVIVLKFDLLSSLAAETERLESLLSALGLSSLSAASVAPAEHIPLNHSSSLRTTNSTSKRSKSDIDLNPEDSAPLLPSHTSQPDDNTTTATGAILVEPDGPLLPSSPSPHTLPDSPPTAPHKLPDSMLPIQRFVGEQLSVDGLSICLPKSGAVLFKSGLSFSLSANQSLLIMGPSGCGKSSLLRVISGLWNTGQGTIVCAREEDSFFLPQKPYMTLGSLREQLLFPQTSKAVQQIGDESLLQLLDRVSLPDIATKFAGGLDELRDWSGTLSMGEQQRIAFGRLLLHQPKMAFLDEATSALDVTNERKLYAQMAECIPCYVSVAHRLSLVPYHTNVLWYDNEKCLWNMTSSQEFSKLHALSVQVE